MQDEAPELEPQQRQIVQQLLYLTGREDRLSRQPLLDKEQILGVRAIWPCLRDATDPPAGCDLLNRLLLTLGIRTVSFDFFETVFQNVLFSDPAQISERVERFRTVCMLEFGNFRHGYRQFRQGAFIRDKWRAYFPSDREVEDREGDLKSRPEPTGLTNPSDLRDQLFSLGYLAGEHAAKINAARQELKTILDSALEARVAHFRALRDVAQRQITMPLTQLIGQVGLPGAEALADPDSMLFGAAGEAYCDVLREVAQRCVPVGEDAIPLVRQRGLQNARTYMAMHDLDVYVATSMREPLDFAANWTFVQRLFHGGTLATWRLRYLDPTQAYLKDPVQKGLLECLMIKRARLTVYNAQEKDAFGKDSEAAVTLAQGRPVIVYVARVLEKRPEMAQLYGAIDHGERLDPGDLADSLVQAELLSKDERDELVAAGKTKGDVIRAVVEKHVPGILGKLGEDAIAADLIHHGYVPKGDLIAFASERILNLELRALTFREVHPLSLQTFPDGVARGVMVTRSLEQTAQVLRGVMLGCLKYEIYEDKNNWLLLESITGSAVRVVTKDLLLTTAFWDEPWGSAQRNEK